MSRVTFFAIGDATKYPYSCIFLIRLEEYFVEFNFKNHPDVKTKLSFYIIPMYVINKINHMLRIHFVELKTYQYQNYNYRRFACLAELSKLLWTKYILSLEDVRDFLSVFPPFFTLSPTTRNFAVSLLISGRIYH